MTRKRHFIPTIAALAALMVTAAPASAQQDDRRDRSQEPFQQEYDQRSAQQFQEQDDQRTGQQFDQQQDRQFDRQRMDRRGAEQRSARPRTQRRQQGQQEQGQQDRQMRLRPSGWVRVAVDYDQDNRFDAMETIYYYDLVEARERSAQRRGGQGQSLQRRGQDRQARRQMARSQRPQQQRRQRDQLRRISGRVSDLTTIRLNDGQAHRLAKVETQQGRRVPVDLGRQEQVQRLNLQEGDRITVWGNRARINDRPVLCARRIQSQDQQITIDRERDRNLKRVRGQIANLRTTRFRGKDQQFRVARVELNSGRTESVILGPQDQLNNLNLQQGDDVRLLVRPGRLNGQQVLVADQIRANERTVRVPRPEERRLSSRQRN